MTLDIHIEQVDEHLMACVAGAVDVASTPLFTRALADAATLLPHTTGMVVDLRDTTFFGASGLSALARVASHGIHTGFSLVVITTRDNFVRRVITLEALTEILPVADTVVGAQRVLRARQGALRMIPAPAQGPLRSSDRRSRTVPRTPRNPYDVPHQ
ncbi:STAS domain-containing protein [Actinophytocola sp. NPDC049390]|uniref:STAS domain-containing protein n=1 Tax=Actinophytocola sp. NPDC049390 TaxID=3363894 RepID=UPI0037BC3435